MADVQHHLYESISGPEKDSAYVGSLAAATAEVERFEQEKSEDSLAAAWFELARRFKGKSTNGVRLLGRRLAKFSAPEELEKLRLDGLVDKVEDIPKVIGPDARQIRDMFVFAGPPSEYLRGIRDRLEELDRTLSIPAYEEAWKAFTQSLSGGATFEERVLLRRLTRYMRPEHQMALRGGMSSSETVAALLRIQYCVNKFFEPQFGYLPPSYYETDVTRLQEDPEDKVFHYVV